MIANFIRHLYPRNNNKVLKNKNNWEQNSTKKKKNLFSREIFSALDDLKVNKKPSIYEVMGFKRRLDKTLDGSKKNLIFFLSLPMNEWETS